MSGSVYNFWQETSDSTLTAPQAFNAITIPTLPSGATGNASTYAGICKDINNWFGAYYDSVAGKINWQYDFAGSIVSGTAIAVTASAGYQVGVGVIRLHAHKLGLSQRRLDVCRDHDHERLRPHHVGQSDRVENLLRRIGPTADLATVYVSNLQGGRFGGVGMRDLKPVVNTDWTTYQPGSNTIYFVATAGCPPGAEHHAKWRQRWASLA